MEESRHYKLARKVLRRLKVYLEGKGMTSFYDSYPFHILVWCGRRLYSLHCGGFHPLIDVHELRCDGHPDNRFEERTYSNGYQVYRFLRSRSKRAKN